MPGKQGIKQNFAAGKTKIKIGSNAHIMCLFITYLKAKQINKYQTKSRCHGNAEGPVSSCRTGMLRACFFIINFLHLIFSLCRRSLRLISCIPNIRQFCDNLTCLR